MEQIHDHANKGIYLVLKGQVLIETLSTWLTLVKFTTKPSPASVMKRGKDSSGEF
jgi:hypothetical protein